MGTLGGCSFQKAFNKIVGSQLVRKWTRNGLLTKTAQVELWSARVEAPAVSPERVSAIVDTTRLPMWPSAGVTFM